MSTLTSRPRKVAVISVKSFGLLLALIAIAYLMLIYLSAQFGGTRNGPLPKDDGGPVSSSVHVLLSEVPNIRKLSNDSIRFAAMPSTRGKWFAVALSDNGNKVQGYAVIWDRQTQTESTEQFTVPSTVYARMMGEFDNKIDGHWGDATLTYDGTTLAFERKREKRLVSGMGNSTCHYAVITNVLARNLSAYVPKIAELVEPGAENYAQSKHCNVF